MRIGDALWRRRVAVGATGVLLAGFLLTSFVIVPAITHRGWQYPSDIWSNYQLAHNISLGDYPYIYFQASLVASPAFLLVLVPLEFVTRHLGMTTGFGIAIPHPSAWPVVAPVVVLLSSTALFAADSLADHLGADARARMVMGLAGAVALGSVVWWGHPEDAIAVAFLLYAVRAVFGGRWIRAAWLLGFGVAFQPLIALAIPAVLLPVGWRRLPASVVRVVVPTALLLALPLLKDPSDTVRAVVQQPVFPALSRPTVWMHLAPSIADQVGNHGQSVAGGPVRVVSALLAVAIGLWYLRRAPRPEVLVWCVTLTLAFRYLFEPGVEPYYAWPALAVGLLGSAVWRSRVRLWWVAGAAAVLTWVVNVRVHTGWLWWPSALLLLVYVTMVAPPQLLARRPPEVGADGDSDNVGSPSTPMTVAPTDP